MQHLLARVLFKENSRASFRFLDGVIKDVEAWVFLVSCRNLNWTNPSYQHVAWAYAFRFLRVFLSISLSNHQDIISALGHLRNILAMSSTWGDQAISAIASTLEALIYLRESNSAESIEQAQCALANARSSQLDSMVGAVSQITALVQFADLCCTLEKFDPNQAVSKMHVMQATLEKVNEGHGWTEDGSFAVPIAHPAVIKPATQNGVIRSSSDGSLILLFNWMPRGDIYNLGFLLSSIAIAHKNSSDGQKAEQMLKEGIQMQESQ